MKKIIILFLTGLFIISFIFIYKFYYTKVTKINIYEISKYNQLEKNYLFSLTNTKNINILMDSLKHSKKINGMIDVLPANYSIELYYNGNRKEVLYLWLNKESNINSMYMYANNKASNGYIISEQYTNKLQQLINNFIYF